MRQAAARFAKWIYFMRPVGADGPVKIGISRFPQQRLVEATRCSPYPLELAAVLPGDDRQERRFHARFEHLHSHGEWFRPAPELSATIEAIRAGDFDPETLPTGKNLYAPGRRTAAGARA